MLTGGNLRIVRKAKGWTQQEFAHLLGVTVSTVYKWESSDADKLVPQKYWAAIKAIRRNSRSEAELKGALVRAIESMNERQLQRMIATAEELSNESENPVQSGSGRIRR